MQTFHGVIRDSRGDACPNAPVTVYVRGTETLAEPLFAADGTTGLDNPFNSSPEGVVEFAAANGAYDIKVTTPGGVLDLDVILFDPADALSLTGSVLAPSATWPDVPALGSDPINAQAQALLNITENLKLLQAFINVKDQRFGAIGNGVNDDTSAIQAAIDYAHSLGVSVYFPRGHYRVTSSLRLYSSMLVLGAGADYHVGGVEQYAGCILEVASNGIMAGEPVFDVSGCRYTTVMGFTLLVAGGDETGNTTVAIADSSSEPASFLTITHNRSRYFGGPFVKLFGNVNTIMWNRANQHNSHILHLDDSSDNFIAFNDFGSHPANESGTTDACIYLDGGANNSIAFNHLYNHGYGVRAVNLSNHNRIEGNRCEKHSCGGMQFDSSSDNTVLGNQLFNNGLASGKQGIDIKNGSNRNDISKNFIFYASYFPGALQLRGVQVSGNSRWNNLSGNYIVNMGEDSIRVDSSDFTKIDGNCIHSSQQRGISITASNDVSVQGNYLYMCGQAADNTYDQIFVGTSSRTTIRGNTIRHGGGSIQARYGIRVDDLGCSTTTIWTNDVITAGRSAQISDLGTSTEIRVNRGFATDNKGTATVGAGSTSAVVTHSLGRTPALQDITVTPTTTWGSATKFWTSNATATQFTINVDVAPGGSGMGFAWRAEVIR